MKIDNPTQFRNNMRLQFDNIMQNKTKSTNLEIGVYNYALKEATNRKVVRKWDNEHFVQLYVDRLRTIYINLKNPIVLKQLTDNTFTTQVFAYMSHHEMLPEKWDDLIQKKIIRDKTKYDTQIEAATDTFTCRKCKSNKCTYYQMQTRSADEPMTTFVSCIDCGNRWKC
jgi:transcription elongation factor S-II